MVTISLTDLEAVRLCEKLKGYADEIEANALRELRPVAPVEELQICALAEIFKQTSDQLPKSTHDRIQRDQAEFNKEHREDQERKSKQN